MHGPSQHGTLSRFQTRHHTSRNSPNRVVKECVELSSCFVAITQTIIIGDSFKVGWTVAAIRGVKPGFIWDA